MFRAILLGAVTSLVAAPSYQAFQHFITHAPWDVAPVWRRLLTKIPDRRGVVILDDTGFPKQGLHSVGVQRQYGHRREHRRHAGGDMGGGATRARVAPYHLAQWLRPRVAGALSRDLRDAGRALVPAPLAAHPVAALLPGPPPQAPPGTPGPLDRFKQTCAGLTAK